MNYKFGILLDSLLNHSVSRELIKDIYTYSDDIAFELIENYFFGTQNFSKIRSVIPNPCELFSASKHISHIKEFRAGENSIFNNSTPDETVLKYFYDTDSNLVARHFNLFFDLNIKRKCGLPYVAHLYRISAIVHQLFRESDKRYHYTTLSAIHDSLEDIPIKLAKRNHDINFEYMDVFLSTYVPGVYIPELLILTNIYDLLIGCTEILLMEDDLGFTPNNIIPHLESFFGKTNLFREEIKNLVGLLAIMDVDVDFVRTLRWQTYTGYYLPKIVQKCIDTNNFSLIELKTLDLLDNAWGMSSLDITGKTRQILKRQQFINLIKNSGINHWSVNHHIIELQNQTIYDAREMIITYLSKERLQLDYLQTSLQLLKILLPILTETETEN